MVSAIIGKLEIQRQNLHAHRHDKEEARSCAIPSFECVTWDETEAGDKEKLKP